MSQRKLTSEEIVKNKKSIDEIRLLPRTPIVAILDNIRSLYNVGAMFRTSDGLMLKKIYLCGMTGIPPRKEIEKTSLGASQTVPWEYRKKTIDIVKELKEEGYQIIALELTDPPMHYAKANFSFPVALIVGHEINGVSDEVMNEVDLSISIPMLGRANSLNVATAYGIATYQILYKYQNNVSS
ncbi:RNA methyltransferase [bacterium]|nr:RNA methyltransferase [bacterium]